MTLVKICGLRRPEDAIIMNACIPDYVGFVFAKSKRQVDKFEARRIARKLDPAIRLVGVFCDMPAEDVDEIASFVGLDVVQLHSDTTQEYFDHLTALFEKRYPRRTHIWQRIAIPSDAESEDCILSGLRDYPALSSFDALILDVRTESAEGGTGIPFPWAVGKSVADVLSRQNAKIIIAGGISADNALAAEALFHPYALDVSSSVETDGFKDREKVAGLIRTLKEKAGKK